MNFRGTFEHALDAKHRLTVPAKFRAALAGGVVLAASHEISEGSARSVSIWTPSDYDAFTDRVVGNMNPFTPQARMLTRFLNNRSFEAELDAANRLMIPPFLMRYAKLDKEVVVAGSGECIEVWDRAAYESYDEDVLSRIPGIAASLGDTA